MKRLLLLILTVSLMGLAQTPEPRRPSHRHPEDPDSYCLAGPPVENDKHGHECHCELLCNGTTGEQMENTECQEFCAKERCTCWGDAAGKGEDKAK